MNPNNGQTPLDYLNHIAPQTVKQSPFKFNLKTVIIGGIILIVLVCILAAITSASGASRKEPWVQLSVRITNTQTVATDATSRLKDSRLRSLNSDLKISLTNTQRDLSTILTQLQVEVDPKKIPPSVAKLEDTTAMTERLTNGRMNGKFDSTYAREMSYKLATILALYQKLYSSTRNPDTQKFLTTAYNNLEPTQKSLASFSDAHE